MRHISKGRTTTLSECRREYWYRYHYGGAGLEVPGIKPDLFGGILLHKGMETLFKELSLDRAIEEIQATPLPEGASHLGDYQLEEAQALAEGFVRAWDRTLMGPFLSERKILGVEYEADLLLAPGLSLYTKTDLVTEVQATGMVEVVDWKSTQDIRDWNRKWRNDIQTWTQAVAVEAKLGRTVSGTTMVGFYKGQRRDGLLTSPLIYGYRKGEDIIPYYKAGYAKFPIWREFPMADWIGDISRDQLESQFVFSSSLPKTDSVVEGWLGEVVRDEMDAEHFLEDTTEEDQKLFFRRNIGKRCNWCPFEPICFERSTEGEMIKAGILVKRESPLNDRNSAKVDFVEGDSK